MALFTALLRRLRLERLSFVFNLIIFAVSFAIISLCLTYIKSELNYDQWVQDSQHAYRAHVEISPPNAEKLQIATISPNVADIIAQNPNVIGVTRIAPEIVTINKDGVVYPEFILSADPNFFKIFGIKLRDGNANNALNTPNSAVLTNESAQKYFGNENPIGKTLTLSNGTVVNITGIIDHVPTDTHLILNIIISSVGNATNLAKQATKTTYGDMIAYTYFWLKQGATIDNTLQEINQQTTLAPIMSPEETNFLTPRIKAMPLSDIHLNNLPQSELLTGGSYTLISAFLLVSIFLIIILAVNYTILTIFNGQKHLEEYGLKRALGASIARLVFEKYIENIVILFISACIGFIILLPSLSIINTFTGIDLHEHKVLLFVLILPAPIIIASIATLLMILPAQSLFRLPIRTLLLGGRNGKQMWRNAIPIILQFFATSFLLIATIVIINQTNFALNESISSAEKNIYVVQNTNTTASATQIQTAKEELLKNEYVHALASSFTVPTDYSTSIMPIINSAKGETIAVSYFVNFVDGDFFSIYNLPTLAGRVFSTQSIDSSSKYSVLSQSAAYKLGYTSFQQAIGKEIGAASDDGTEYFQIIGVVPDLLFKSIESPPEAVIYMSRDENTPPQDYLSIELKQHLTAEQLQSLEKIWTKVTGDPLFKGHYLKEMIAREYQALTKAQRLFSVFSIVALLTAAVGIYAFSSILALRQKHEIGIRRALGASRGQIIKIMFVRFFSPILIGYLMAVIPAYIITNMWLNNYTYHIKLGASPALITIFIVLIVGFVSMGHNLYHSSFIPPSKALRTDG